MPQTLDEKKDLEEILGMESSRSKWPRRVVILLILLVLGLGGLWYFRQPSGAAATVSFRTAEATRGNLEVIVSATGTLEPVNQVDVGTEVSGTVNEVLVDFNDPVEEGQVLARLDTTKLEAQRDQAQAALAVAKAELSSSRAAASEAKTSLDRLKRTYQASGGRLPSRQELDEAQAAYTKAVAQVGVSKASIAQSEASLKVYETELTKAVIKSPINGLVLDRAVDPGQTVAASLQAPVLFTLAENLTNMSLYVSVDEADVGQVKEGQRASFVVDAYPDQRFPAHITQVRFAPQDEDGVVTYESILEVDNSDLLLRPGMTATADIVTVEVKDAVLVPNAALRFTPAVTSEQMVESQESEQSFISKIMPGPRRRSRQQKGSTNNHTTTEGAKVWILENGQPVPKPVTPGSSDGVNTQIASEGLEPGALVIVGQTEAAQ